MSHLLFLAGANGDPNFWKFVVQQLPFSSDQITLQHYPEFAGYPAVPTVHNFDQLCDWIIEQIAEPTVIIAQSMGGVIAIQAKLRKPELIQKLVLIATSGGIDVTSFYVQDWRTDYLLANTSQPAWFAEAQYDFSSDLHLIDCPVLLIFGDDDDISPVSVGQYLEYLLPNAHLHIVHGGQHDLVLTHSTEVAQQINTFLQN